MINKLFKIATIAFLLLLPPAAFAQKITVRGRVLTSPDNLPAIGAAILSSEGGGTVTDGKGYYSLETSPDATITFSSLGYIDVVENVNGRAVIDVILSEDSELLDEVVVLGYTMQKRSELSSAVVTLSEERLADVTTPDVGNMLQGKVAGVVSMNSSGQPGSEAEIRIRGTGSITAGAGPLYVVDGVAGGSFSANDIETITVLKDASATALYGASAAGGVIVVTTKSAKGAETHVDFKATAGIKKALTGRFHPMNSEELYYTQQSFLSKSMFNSTRPESLLNQDFDWMSHSFSTGIVQDYYASVTGKAGTVSYFASIDHYDEEGSLVNTNYKHNTARLNLSVPIGKKVNLNFRLAYKGSSSRETSTYMTLECAYQCLPWDNPFDVNTGEPLYVDGEVRSDNGLPWYSNAKDNIFHSEHYNFAEGTGESFMGDIQFNWNITPWLMLTSTNRFSSDLSAWTTYIDPRTATPCSGNGSLEQTISRGKGWGTTNLLKANQNFGEHNLSGVIGWEYGGGHEYLMGAKGVDMPAGQTALSNCTMENIEGYDYGSLAWALLAQMQYSYKGKYIATASIRYDETSRFAPKARGGFFPGISAAWVVSKEGFMQGQKFFKLLKLRAGYGKTGNDNIEQFLWQDTYAISNKYELKPAAVLVRNSNPNLGWEEAYMTSFGIDAETAPGIDFTLDLYNTTNTNLLLAVPLATSTGFFEFMDNVGTINNKGIEFALNAALFRHGDFRWNAGFNVGLNRNRVVELPNGEFLNTTTQGVKQVVREGLNLYSWYMPVWHGIDPENGDPLWDMDVLDDEGNPTGEITTTNIYSQARWDVVGEASPKFSGGLFTNISWKGLFLNANFYGVYGNKIYNYTRHTLDSDGAYPTINLMSLNNGLGWVRWDPDDESTWNIATHPKPKNNGNRNANSYSSRYLEDGSFLRLKNVTIGYNLPKSITEKMHMSHAKIYVSADNILTFSRFSGCDPEVRLENSTYYLAGTFSGNYPVPMTVVGGIEINF